MSFVATQVLPKIIAGPFPQVIRGLDLASEAYFLADLARNKPDQSFVRITTDLPSAFTLKQNLEFFLNEAASKKIIGFPSHETLPYTGIVAGTDTAAERMTALYRLTISHPFILIAPWQALLKKTIPKNILRKSSRTLHLGEDISREELVRFLQETGYNREVVVESLGSFALRGALIDIFTPQEEYPLRLEFDGDTLVEIRYFDPATQTSLRTTDIAWGMDKKQITLIPAKEILLTPECSQYAIKQIKRFSDDLELPATLRKEVAEKIENKTFFTGIETFLPAFYEEPTTLLDYIHPETIVFLPGMEELTEETSKFRKEVESLYAATKSLEKIISPHVLLCPFDALEKQLEGFSKIFINPLLSPEVQNIPTHVFSVETSEVLKNLWNLSQIKKWSEEGLKTRLVCHTEIQAERLKDLLMGQNISHHPVQIGKLSHGFFFKDEGLIVLTEEEIFGHKTIRRIPKVKEGVPFTSFAELKVGDHLVHEEHGIARYRGLTHLNIQGTPGDYLNLEFFGNDKLYLPVYRLHVIQRYIGSPTPPLDKLGGIRWGRLKKKVKEQVYQIAGELLKIHAQREVFEGFSFPAPDLLDEEFASHFPYDETPDQAHAIDDVLRDLQKPKPMDRFICGDVGYGKTEVAMRAAFKAVNSGKQVALLVPTTILALQHFETFQERFSKLAVSVEMLSRFRSPKGQKEIVEKLSHGRLDIVIGTHRLFMRDVRFKNLGLLIIDEEHRFGVRHKEKIKKLKPTVDVLSLSATPIPRTLHLSLIGLRDFSMIQTPPTDRISVRTFIAKWDEALICHAVGQELARQGQVFFVHNRVQTIESIHKKLEGLFPKARIAVAHGQMKESDLEKVMLSFLHQKTQILLTTTIIESGIDVPNANTMLINRADTFGLAQLYQLRGRVGRSDRQATCYLLVPDEEVLTTDAKHRLTALTRYTDLGSGFQIAAHDLEIRGAGNLLGTAQSGFIEEIGYELYTKLLAQAIQKLKGEKVLEELDTEIQLKISAFIPEDYVQDINLRMSLYKRMSHLTTLEEIEAFSLELEDRFGKVPQPLQHLLAIIEIKQLALKLRLKSIQFVSGRFILNWDSSTPIQPKTLMELTQKNPNQYQLKPPGLFLIKTSAREASEVLAAAKKVLSEFLRCVSEHF